MSPSRSSWGLRCPRVESLHTRAQARARTHSHSILLSQREEAQSRDLSPEQQISAPWTETPRSNTEEEEEEEERAYSVWRILMKIRLFRPWRPPLTTQTQPLSSEWSFLIQHFNHFPNMWISVQYLFTLNSLLSSFHLFRLFLVLYLCNTWIKNELYLIPLDA